MTSAVDGLTPELMEVSNLLQGIDRGRAETPERGLLWPVVQAVLPRQGAHQLMGEFRAQPREVDELGERLASFASACHLFRDHEGTAQSRRIRLGQNRDWDRDTPLMQHLQQRKFCGNTGPSQPAACHVPTYHQPLRKNAVGHELEYCCLL
jgi:hypothetical protein